jgi:hypothetical protein
LGRAERANARRAQTSIHAQRTSDLREAEPPEAAPGVCGPAQSGQPPLGRAERANARRAQTSIHAQRTSDLREAEPPEAAPGV